MQRLLLPRPVAPRPARRFRTLRCPRPSAAVEATAPEPLTVPPAPASPPPPPAEDGAARSAKDALLRLVGGTQRGVAADAAARVAVQEAVLAVEARCAAGPLDTVGALAGVWRLLYTTALDVLVLLEAERRQPLALFTVGDIYQTFDARGGVENVIRFSGVLGSVTARVSATYAPVGARSLSLRFTEAAVGDAAPSAGLEALLAPASLPRGPAQLALLAFLRAARVALPVPGGGAMSATGTGSYLISFCDHEMMIGRALSGGGLFVFSRAADDAAQGDGLGDGA